MSQVRIRPQFWFDQLPNFQPDDSMAECHAERAVERIAEKKAEGNVEKLEKLVDQLKGKIDSKDTVIKSEVKSAKIIEISIQILFTFIQRPASTGSKRRSRKSSVSYGYIKDMGLLQKIVDKIFFCMSRNSRIGIFLSIELIAEVLGLGSLVSTIMLLIKIGFPLQGVILFLLSVRI